MVQVGYFEGGGGFNAGSGSFGEVQTVGLRAVSLDNQKGRGISRCGVTVQLLLTPYHHLSSKLNAPGIST